MDRLAPELERQYWALVDGRDDPDACWSWTGQAHSGGYGTFNVGVRHELAHRLALELSGTPIPPGLVVVHLCGNKRCCNPAHLRVVTRSEYMKGRRSRLRRIPPFAIHDAPDEHL
jgi:hypothetical protein